MKAFLIPADSSAPVKPINFDPNESWRHILTRYHDPGKHPWIFTEVAFLTKENAQRDNLLRNSRASEYLKNHSEHLDSPEDLYGDVVVLGYDSALEKLTDLPWPRRPEDFEDLLTEIVTPPTRVPTPAENALIIAEWERKQAEERAWEAKLNPKLGRDGDALSGRDPHEWGGARPPR